jgi:hypothetical protein
MDARQKHSGMTKRFAIASFECIFSRVNSRTYEDGGMIFLLF